MRWAKWFGFPKARGWFLTASSRAQISRQLSATTRPIVLLANVKASQVELDARGGVRAWRWELELTPARKETHLPLRFTFEAAQTKP